MTGVIVVVIALTCCKILGASIGGLLRTRMLPHVGNLPHAEEPWFARHLKIARITFFVTFAISLVAWLADIQNMEDMVIIAFLASLACFFVVDGCVKALEPRD